MKSCGVESISVPKVEELLLQEVELRCPVGPRKLFAKLRLAGVPPLVTADNLFEISCQDCRRRLRLQGKKVKLILHRFSILGELVETVIVAES